MSNLIFPRDIWRVILADIHPIERIRLRGVCWLLRNLIGEPKKIYDAWQYVMSDNCIKHAYKFDNYNNSICYKLPDGKLINLVFINRVDVQYYDSEKKSKVSISWKNFDKQNKEFLSAFNIHPRPHNRFYTNINGQMSPTYGVILLPFKLLNLGPIKNDIIRGIYEKFMNEYEEQTAKELTTSGGLEYYILYHYYFKYLLLPDSEKIKQIKNYDLE